MKTNDPNLTKTPIEADDHAISENSASSDTASLDTVSSDTVSSDTANLDTASSDTASLDTASSDTAVETSQRELSPGTKTSNAIDKETTVNKGTDTFDENVVGTEHVKDGDIPARQPDRRDEQGSNAFDEGVNEDTTAHYDKSEPKSEDINERNRYATVDNAQSRVLNTADQHEDGTLIDSE